MMHLGAQLALGACAAYVALVAHEAGHLLAGRCAGFRFGMLCVGPLAIVRRGPRLALRALPPSHWGPFGVCFPTSIDRCGARFAWVIAGGPLTSLGVALLAVACVPILHDPLSRLFVRWLALLSGALFVGTAQPFGSGTGVPSDGGRAWRQLRGGEEARRDVAFVALAGLVASGVRPRDWDAGLLERIRGVEKPVPHRLEAASLFLQQALDRGDADVARERAREIRELLPRVQRWARAEAAADAAWWYARVAGDATVARELLDHARGGLGEAHRVLRAEAAALAAAGDRGTARTTLARARAALDRGMFPASAWDREQIEALSRELEAAPVGAAVPLGTR